MMNRNKNSNKLAYLTVKKKYYENYYVCSVTQSNETIITILNPQPSYWYLST